MFIVHLCIAIPSLLLNYDTGAIYVLWSLGLKFCSLNPFGSCLIFVTLGQLPKSSFDHKMYFIFGFFLDILVLLFDHFEVFGWVWVRCFNLYINFSSFWFFVTLGHLRLPFALKFIPFNSIHQTIYFISELPKTS